MGKERQEFVYTAVIASYLCKLDWVQMNELSFSLRPQHEGAAVAVEPGHGRDVSWQTITSHSGLNCTWRDGIPISPSPTRLSPPWQTMKRALDIVGASFG